MKPIAQVDGRVAVLDRPDVDTDQIIPKQFLKRIERTGYGQYAFFDWRFDEDGNERPGFELNRPAVRGATHPARGAQLRLRLVARARRLGAPGLRIRRRHRAVVRRHLPHERRQGRDGRSSSCPTSEVKRLMESVDLDRGSELTVDLEALTVTTPAGEELPFAFDESTRYRLLNGLDDIGLTLQHEAEITAYERARRRSAR